VGVIALVGYYRLYGSFIFTEGRCSVFVDTKHSYRVKTHGSGLLIGDGNVYALICMGIYPWVVNGYSGYGKPRIFSPWYTSSQSGNGAIESTP